MSASIKAQTAECVNPARDRVNELNAMERKVRDAKRAVGFDSEAAVEAALAEAESRMNHESLSVLEQKRTLREMSKLRAKRPEAAALESTIRTLENAAEERARLGAELKASRDALEPLREKRAMSLKIVDHYAGCVDAAVDDSAEEYAAKTAKVTEVKRLRKEGYEARKARRETAQSREREEWLLARRTYGRPEISSRMDTSPRLKPRASGRWSTCTPGSTRTASTAPSTSRDLGGTGAAGGGGEGCDRSRRGGYGEGFGGGESRGARGEREKERAEASREKEERNAPGRRRRNSDGGPEERAAADAALAEDVRRRAELAGVRGGSRGRRPVVRSHRPRRSSAPPRSPPPSRGRWTNPRQRHLPRVQTAARPFPTKLARRSP